jgi:hypothetical protein
VLARYGGKPITPTHFPSYAPRRSRGSSEHTSTTLDDLDSYGWANSTLVTGDLADALTGLKRQPGGDIVCWAAPSS